MKSIMKTTLMLAVAGIAAFTVSAQTGASAAGVKVMGVEAGTAAVSTPDAAARVSGASVPGVKVGTVTVVDEKNAGKATGVDVLGVKAGTAAVATPDAAARVSGVSAPGVAAGTVTVVDESKVSKTTGVSVPGVTAGTVTTVDEGKISKTTGVSVLGVGAGATVTTGPDNEGTTVTVGVKGPRDGGAAFSFRLKRPGTGENAEQASPECKGCPKAGNPCPPPEGCPKAGNPCPPPEGCPKAGETCPPPEGCPRAGKPCPMSKKDFQWFGADAEKMLGHGWYKVRGVTEQDDIFSWYCLPNGHLALVYNKTCEVKGQQEPLADATVYALNFANQKLVTPGRLILTLVIPGRSKAKCTASASLLPVDVNPALQNAATIRPGTILAYFAPKLMVNDSVSDKSSALKPLPPMKDMFWGLWTSTGIYDVIEQTKANFSSTWLLGVGRVLMICVGILLLYLAIFRGFEPLLLFPIGFGAVLSNIPVAGISGPDGLLGMTYNVGIESGVFPLLIFMGVGAMTDFGPLIANPKTALLGGGAQLGIFTALIGALVLNKLGIQFDLKDAGAIGIIGGADGPTAIFLASRLSPKLLGAIAVAAYSYMALVPIIQPPIMKALTTKEEKLIKMKQSRPVHKFEKVCFPILITLLCAFLLPDAAPLIGMLMLGNLMNECGVVERLNQTTQNALCNIVTIFLGLSVGSKLSADQFLSVQTLGILVLGCIAFCIGTAGGVLFAKIMNLFLKEKINPLIGAAGVSAVPMAARVVNKVGLEYDSSNFLLMHAMGPNVSGVIGSAVAAGVLLKALGGL